MKIEPPNDHEQRLDELSEQKIVHLAKTDPQAISYLYRQNYGAIHRYVNRRVGNLEDTNDIVADVFMTMVRYLPRFRWTGAPFRSWLLVLATNQINRWIRNRRFSRLWRPFDASEKMAIKTSDLEEDRMEVVRIALLDLPLAIQTVLTLHYFEDLSVDAIAEIMNCRPGTVKSRLSRGRELLRSKTSIQEETNTDEQRTVGKLLKKFEV